MPKKKITNEFAQAVFNLPWLVAQEEGWQILRADYGFKNQRNDVTDILKDLIGRGGVNGVYKITQLLPPEGDDRQYRIKNSNEPHERVVKESQLTRVA